MKRLAIPILALMALTSCDAFSNPRAREATVVQTYTNAVVALTSARKAGDIGDEDWATIKAAIRVAKQARLDLKAAREENRPADVVDLALSAAMNAMAEVIAHREAR